MWAYFPRGTILYGRWVLPSISSLNAKAFNIVDDADSKSGTLYPSLYDDVTLAANSSTQLSPIVQL